MLTLAAEPRSVNGVETLLGASLLSNAKVVCKAWRRAANITEGNRGVLRYRASISRDVFAPFCAAVLPDGRLVAADAAGRQLLLLSAQPRRLAAGLGSCSVAA